MRNVCTSSAAREAGSTCRMATNVRIISPETISSVSASATCATTSALRVRCRPGASLADRPPSLSAAMPGLPNLSDGKQAEQHAAQHRDRQREEQHRAGRCRCRRRAAAPPAPSFAAAPMAACASTTPSAPPASASSTLSDSSARAMRPRLAPSAARIASSCWRAFGAHQEQVRDVAAGDQQHDADGRQENPQHLRRRCRSRRRPAAARSAAAPTRANDRRQQRDHARQSALAWASVTPGFSRASAWKSNSMPRGASARRAASAAATRGVGAQELERRGQHADDLGRRAVDLERLADDVLGAAEPALPVAVGQDHPQRLPGVSSSALKSRPTTGCTRKQRQRAVADRQRLDTLRIAASGDRDLVRTPRRRSPRTPAGCRDR